MLVKTTGRPSSRSRRAVISPRRSPGSITAASTSGAAPSRLAPTTGSYPSRRTTCSSNDRTSAWGSTSRTFFATFPSWLKTAGAWADPAYEFRMDGEPRILVVDDDDDIRMLLRELFTRAGYEVTEASDGREALRRIFEAPPALVVLDVTMPEM